MTSTGSAGRAFGISVTDRPSLHASKRVGRNLRAAPAMLTDARIGRILAMLDAAPRRAAPVSDPASVARSLSTPPAADAALKDAIKAFLAPIAATSLETPVAASRQPRAKPAPVAPQIGTAPLVASASVADYSTPRAPQFVRPPRSSALAPAVMPPRLPANVATIVTPRATTLAAAERVGIQNASVAIAWLRSNGVSVKAESTSVFGTRWLVSNEYAKFDAAGIVALARRKGFAG